MGSWSPFKAIDIQKDGLKDGLAKHQVQWQRRALIGDPGGGITILQTHDAGNADLHIHLGDPDMWDDS